MAPRPSDPRGDFEFPVAHVVADALCDDDVAAARRRRRLGDRAADRARARPGATGVLGPGAHRGGAGHHDSRRLRLARQLEGRTRRSARTQHRDLARQRRGAVPLGLVRPHRAAGLPRRRRASGDLRRGGRGARASNDCPTAFSPTADISPSPATRRRSITATRASSCATMWSCAPRRGGRRSRATCSDRRSNRYSNSG